MTRVAGASLRTVPGALAAEAATIEAARDAALDLWRRGGPLRPVLVVVPSQSLRLHLAARLAAAGPRGALVGVECVTHFGLALRIVERLGLAPPRGLDLFAVLARRFARREPVLAHSLEELREGYSGILGAVRDLLDAGLEAAHLEAIEEVFEGEGRQVASEEEIERALALTRVTARTLAAFAELGVGRGSTLLQAATEAVRSRPDEALVADRVVLHGYADATGVTTDFLQALLDAYGGLVVVDRPPDPVVAGQPDASAVFTERLVERLSTSSTSEDRAPEPAGPRLRLFRALGQEAEVREVAQRCLALLEEGHRPEGIGVVMREPAPYLSLLRGTFDAFGLPFSGQGLRGAPTPAGRRLRALAELVVSGPRTHVERWLDARSHDEGSPAAFDLRVALAALGVSRLDELAALDVEPYLSRDSYALPVRQGFFEAEEEGEGRRAVRSRRRRVRGDALRAAVATAERLCEVFADWSAAPLPLPDHLERLADVTEILEWGARSDESVELRPIVEAFRDAPPVTIDRDEFALTLRRLTSEAGREDFAGHGGGVQVMGVVDARARTFDHLFVLGMNRGVFPRVVREDPVLPDSLRKLLSRRGHGVLPDLPIKRRGYEEERYLFAQLLSASPEVTLSWLEMDDADRPASPSPLVERLRWCRPDRPADWHAPRLVGRQPLVDLGGDGRPAPAHLSRLPPGDQIVLAALNGNRRELSETWRTLLPYVESERSEADSALVAARVAVLNEIDPTTAAAATDHLSPYLGFLGPAGSEDPRSNRHVYVTLLERLAICPWQAFIERLLRVEAVPDPLEALPRIDALLVGILVHAVLERVVSRSLPGEGRELEDLGEGAVVTVDWLDDEALNGIVPDYAARTVRAAGISLGGFAHALDAVVRPYLEVARWMDWPGGRLTTVAAEVRGEVELALPGLSRRLIGFRADRVDRADAGLVMTDYKTGASPFTQKTGKTRYNRLLADVRKGLRLQPIVYALAAAPAKGLGRFAFLRPRLDGPDEARAVAVTSEDDELRRAFETAAGVVLDAWEKGLFFPRLEMPGEPQKTPNACRWCRVAEACVRQDSGARRRLRTGMDRLAARPDGFDPELHGSLLDHWWLPSPGDRPPDPT